MARHSANLDDQYRRPYGASLLVYVTGNPQLLAVLTGDDGSPLPNPLTIGANGVIIFNAPDGSYDIEYWVGGRLVRIDCNVTVGDLSIIPYGTFVKPAGSVFYYRLTAVLRTLGYDLNASAPSPVDNAAAYGQFIDKAPILPSDPLATYIQATFGLTDAQMTTAFNAAGAQGDFASIPAGYIINALGNGTLVGPSQAAVTNALTPLLPAVSLTKVQNGPTAWLEAAQPGLVSLATQAVFVSPNGGYGVIGATRASDAGTGNPGSDSTIGVAAFAVADLDNVSTHSGYAQGTKTTPLATMPGFEFTAVNTSTIVPVGPYTPNPAGYCAAITASSGLSDVIGSTDTSAVMVVNPATAGQFRYGIVFAEGSISSIANQAIAMANEHQVVHVSTDGITGALSGLAATHWARSNTNAYTTDIIRSAAAGGDTTNGMEIGRYNFNQTIGGTAQLRVALIGRRESTARSSLRVQASAEDSTSASLGWMLEDKTFGADTAAYWNLFSATNPANNIYVSNNVHVTSDASLKKLWGPVRDAVVRAAADTDIVEFQYLKAMADKGDAKARVHCGIIAQDLLAKLHTHLDPLGVDPMTLGVIGKDVDTETVMEDQISEVDQTEEVPDEPHTYYTTDSNGNTVRVQEARTKTVVKRGNPTPVFDNAGEPVMSAPIEAKKAIIVDGEIVREAQAAVPAKQMTVRLPLKTTVTQSVPITRPRKNPDGSDATILNIRYEQLSLLMIASLRARVAALEAPKP